MFFLKFKMKETWGWVWVYTFFSNLGRQYDKEGNVNPWWSEETIAAFDERAQCFIDMYENYTVPELIPILGDDAHVRL